MSQAHIRQRTMYIILWISQPIFEMKRTWNYFKAYTSISSYLSVVGLGEIFMSLFSGLSDCSAMRTKFCNNDKDLLQDHTTFPTADSSIKSPRAIEHRRVESRMAHWLVFFRHGHGAVKFKEPWCAFHQGALYSANRNKHLPWKDWGLRALLQQALRKNFINEGAN